MIFTYHGPRLSIAERIAAKNIAAISTPTRPDYSLTFHKFIEAQAKQTHGKGQEHTDRMREALVELLDEAFARDKITLGEAYNLQRLIRRSLPGC